jgi:hypothetical protein
MSFLIFWILSYENFTVPTSSQDIQWMHFLQEKWFWEINYTTPTVKRYFEVQMLKYLSKTIQPYHVLERTKEKQPHPKHRAGISLVGWEWLKWPLLSIISDWSLGTQRMEHRYHTSLFVNSNWLILKGPTWEHWWHTQKFKNDFLVNPQRAKDPTKWCGSIWMADLCEVSVHFLFYTEPNNTPTYWSAAKFCDRASIVFMLTAKLCKFPITFIIFYSLWSEKNVNDLA